MHESGLDLDNCRDRRHLLPFFMFMTGGRHLLARLAASFLIAASIEIDDGNDQETNG
jgi:hypothetical protein